MIAGKIKCDFCNFLGDLQKHEINRGALKVPDGWIAIHPTVSVYGMRGLKISDPRYKEREKIKEKVLQSVKSIHCCPACANERDVFSNQISLPAPPQAPDINHMKGI